MFSEQPAEKTVHMNATTIGLDIAKSVFQVHGEGFPGDKYENAIPMFLRANGCC